VTPEDDNTSSSPSATILSAGSLSPPDPVIPPQYFPKPRIHACSCADQPLPPADEGLTDLWYDDANSNSRICELYDLMLGGSIPSPMTSHPDPYDIFPLGHDDSYKHTPVRIQIHSLGATPQTKYEDMAQDTTSLHCAHADGGSMVSTTHVKEHLWHYQDHLNHHVSLRVADDHAHSPVGMGYLKIPANGPPGSIGRLLGYRGYHSVSNFGGQDCVLHLLQHQHATPDMTVPLTLVRGLLYTDPIIPPDTNADRSSPHPTDDQPISHVPLRLSEVIQIDANIHRIAAACDGIPQFPAPSCGTPFASPTAILDHDSYHVCHLAQDQLHLLWHQRLGHLNFRRTSDLHRTADGIPKIPIAHDLDNCLICLAAKLKRTTRGLKDSWTARSCNQGISIDTGFIIQWSLDSDHFACSVERRDLLLPYL
jgi:hypothetical protein